MTFGRLVLVLFIWFVVLPLISFAGYFAFWFAVSKAGNEKHAAPTHTASAPLQHNHKKSAAEGNEVQDLNIPEGTTVLAVAAGLVALAGEQAGYGLVVEINHGNGLMTRFNQNSKILVKQGDMVSKGQPIAIAGPLLHSEGSPRRFEVLKDGVPVDPLRFVNERPVGDPDAPLTSVSRVVRQKWKEFIDANTTRCGRDYYQKLDDGEIRQYRDFVRQFCPLCP